MSLCRERSEEMPLGYKRFLYHIPPKRFFRIRYYGAIQRVAKIESIKTIEIKPQQTKVKPKCKKCKCEDIQTVVVVDRYTRVVQGIMTPTILTQKKEKSFDNSG
jgi:hypothetical protein